MARVGRKTELLKFLRTAELILPATASPAATTITAAAAVGATTLTVASITGLAVAQTIAVGTGERKEIVKIHAATAPTGFTVTLDALTPLQNAHDAGNDVVLQQILDLGPVHADGVAFSFDGDPTDVMAESQAFVYAQKTGFLEIMVEFGLMGLMVENLCAALGILLSRIVGSGTTAAPRELFLDLTAAASVLGEQTDCCWRLTGVRNDGTVMQWDCLACELDPTAFSLELGRTANTKVPIRLKVTGGILQRASI